MIEYVSTPNLPTSNCRSIIAGELDNSAIDLLAKYDIKVIAPTKSELLPKSLQNHTDLIVHHCGNGILFTICSQFNLKNCVTIGKSVGAEYPFDVLLNCCEIDKYLICNKNTVAEEILKYSQNLYEIIDVKQGYTKCSIAVINNHSIITEDNGIKTALSKYGFDVLLLDAGGVELNGYDYGFFGGCGGLIAPDKYFFNGDIKLHKQYDEIKKFLYKNEVEPICIENKKLYDIGSIIQFTQEVI